MEKSYPCIHCDKAFSMNFELIIHMRTHSGGKSYLCNDCDAAFSLKSDLISHMESHLGYIPHRYSCVDKNNKTTLAKSRIESQPRAYDGDKIIWERFQCQYCGKGFADKYSRTVHLRSHTGEKPYQCNQCHKSYNRKDNLTMHLKKHSVYRHYQCTHCEQSFVKKSDLINHSRMHKISKNKDVLVAHGILHENDNDKIEPKVEEEVKRMFCETIDINNLSESIFEVKEEELISKNDRKFLIEPKNEFEEDQPNSEAININDLCKSKIEIKEEQIDTVIDTHIETVLIKEEVK